MRLLIVQLSDIHFRSGSNRIGHAFEKLMSAILSIMPKPQACLVVVTGDVAYSGEGSQYNQAVTFFTRLEQELKVAFGGDHLRFDYIPGNHDCVVPEEDAGVRSAIVNSAHDRICQSVPDPGFIRNLLSAQNPFFEFYKQMTGSDLAENSRICRSNILQFADNRSRLVSINTALLSQRLETAGTLYLPDAVLKNVILSDEAVDATICLYH